MSDCKVCNLGVEMDDSVVYNGKFGWIHQGCADLRQIKPNSIAVALIDGSYVEGTVSDVGEGSGLPMYEIGIKTDGGEVFTHRNNVKRVYNGSGL